MPSDPPTSPYEVSLRAEVRVPPFERPGDFLERLLELDQDAPIGFRPAPAHAVRLLPFGAFGSIRITDEVLLALCPLPAVPVFPPDHTVCVRERQEQARVCTEARLKREAILDARGRFAADVVEALTSGLLTCLADQLDGHPDRAEGAH